MKRRGRKEERKKEKEERKEKSSFFVLLFPLKFLLGTFDWTAFLLLLLFFLSSFLPCSFLKEKREEEGR